MSAPDLSTLQKKAENIIPRIADAYIYDDVNANWASMGILEGVEINFEGQTQNADVAGREKMLTIRFDASLVLQQTAEEEFDNVRKICSPAGAGARVKICDQKTAPANVGTATGFEFVNVFPNWSDGTINGNGEGSSFTIEFGAKVLISSFENFDGTVTVDA